MMEEVKVCYGVEYYSDIGSLKYMGSYWNDTRCGRGILYDRQGSIEYEGLWRDDKPLASVSTSISITSDTESVEIPKKSFHHPQSFVLPHYLHSLKRLVIRYKCFIQVRFFELNGLPELESVAVGKKSFFIPFDRPMPGRFRVANCPKLEVIRIGHDSFHSFDSFGLVNLPSLRTLEFGWRCFMDVSSFSLADLPRLQNIRIGGYTFENCQSVVLRGTDLIPLITQTCLKPNPFLSAKEPSQATLTITGKERTLPIG
ncbi:hypothetical protein WA538_004915 [Blastocystis sp. DL]